MTLQEHLGDPRTCAESPVDLGDLEALAEQVSARILLDQVSEDTMGPIAVAQSGPDRHLPGHGESGATISPHYDRLSPSPGELRRSVQRDLAAGVHAVKMREVAVFCLGVVPVFQPFLELAVAADLHGGQSRAFRRELATQRRIPSENLRSRDHRVEQVADNLHVHGRPGTDTRRDLVAEDLVMHRGVVRSMG